MFEHQTVARLAEVAGSGEERLADQGNVSGEVELTPIQRWFFEQELEESRHYNQAVMLEVREGLAGGVVEAVVKALVKHHDALRMRYERASGQWRQINAEVEENEIFVRVDLSGVEAAEQSARLTAEAERAQRGLDLGKGPVIRVVWYEMGLGKAARLLMVIHHLVVDGVSWRILLEDLQKGCEQLMRGDQIRLPAKTTSFQQWARRLKKYAESEEIRKEASYWRAVLQQTSQRLTLDYEGGENTVGSQRVITVALSEAETQTLLQVVPEKYQTQIQDALLMALGQALRGQSGSDSVIVDIEGHGREDLFQEIDVTRTVGWFTTMYPVELTGTMDEPGKALQQVKHQSHGVPQRGIGYGILRYFTETREEWKEKRVADVLFNYLGQFDRVLQEKGFFAIARESVGPARSARMRRDHLLQINGQVAGGRLQVSWGFSDQMHRGETVEQWASEFLKRLRALIEHCQSKEAGGYIPSDFPLAQLSQEELDRLVSEIDDPGVNYE